MSHIVSSGDISDARLRPRTCHSL